MTNRTTHGPRRLAARALPLATAALLAAALPPACAPVTAPGSPFTQPRADLPAIQRTLRENPVQLQRPVVVIGGYRNPDPLMGGLTRRVAYLTSNNTTDFIRIPTWFDDESAPVIDRTISILEARHPSANPDETIEVDVIGLSAGGVIARAAAIPAEGRKRLKIRRLFTIGSPHRGARLAEKLPLDSFAKDLRANSDFLNALDAAWPQHDYELIPYARLADGVVGTANTAPPGVDPIWAPGWQFGSHLTLSADPYILTDIARRLRNEPPLASAPTPLPPSEQPRPTAANPEAGPDAAPTASAATPPASAATQGEEPHAK